MQTLKFEKEFNKSFGIFHVYFKIEIEEKRNNNKTEEKKNFSTASTFHIV